MGCSARRRLESLRSMGYVVYWDLVEVLDVGLVGDFHQVLAVLVLEHGLGEFAEFISGNPAVHVGDAFEASDLEALTFLQHLYIYRGFREGVVCTGVEPCETAGEGLYFQLSVFEKFLIDGCDFQFASGGGLYVVGYFDNLVWIEVEADYGIVAFRMFWFLFDGEAVAVLVEFGDAVAFGVIDPVAEDGGFVLFFSGFNCVFENFGETCTVEDIVAEDEAGRVIADEVLADDECLCESVGRGLFGVGEVDSVVTAVTEKAFESGKVLRGGDDEYIADSGKHEGRDGIIDHRLVEDGEELLAYALGNGI